MVVSHQTLLNMAHYGQAPITPFRLRQVHNGKTYGLGPAGYDIRAAEEVVIPPGGFRLGSSMESFNMPSDLLAYVKDKSSWARQGLCVQNTVIEPGWNGFLTLEYTNHSDKEITIQAGDPIAQIIFHKLDFPTRQPYNGKYQNQEAGPQGAIDE